MTNWRRLFSSTFARPLLPVMTAVFVGVLLSTLVAYFYTRTTVQNLAEQRMTQDLSHLSRALDMRAKDMYYHLELLSQEEMLRLTLEDSYLGQSARAAAQPKLAARVKSGTFDRLLVLNRKGEVVVASNPKFIGAANLSDRDYFKQSMRGESAHQTILSRIGGRTSLAASVPLKGHDGTVLGILSAAKDTDAFSHEVLDGVRVGETGGAYVLNPQGKVIAEPSWAAQGQFAPGEATSSILELAKTGGILRYRRNSVDRICASRINAETGWCLVVEADAAEILQPATRLATLTGLISFITLALVALALGVLRRAMAELRQAEEHSRTITDVSPVGILTCDNAGQLRYANPQARQLLRLSMDEAKTLPPLMLETITGAPLSQTENPIQLALAEGRSVAGALCWNTPPDGARRALSINAAPLLTGGAIITVEDITERRRNVEALINEKRFTEALIDGLPGIFYVYDVDLKLRRWNHNHEVLTGFTAEEMLNRDLVDWQATEEGRKLAVENARHVFREVRPVQIEATLLHKDGRIVPYLLTGVRLDTPDGPMLMGVGFDISERKQAEERLRQSEEKFSRLFRLSPDSILLTEFDTTRIIDVNNAFTRDTGIPREQALGKTLAEVGLRVDPVMLAELRQRQLSEGHVENVELEISRHDAQPIICSVSIQLLEVDGKRYSINIARDVTAVKKMQEMMIQTEKMISVGGIAAGIAHEINNPLGIVLQAAQTLAQRTNPRFRKNMDVAQELGLDMSLLEQYFHIRKLNTFIEDIQAAAMRASAIIRHMLDFSRKSESRRNLCSVVEIIDKAIGLAGNDYDLKKSYDFKK